MAAIPAQSSDMTLSPTERARISVLVVESDSTERNNIRSAVKTLGFGSFSDAPNHANALEKLAQREVTHVIFEAKKTNMPAIEFLRKIMECAPGTICIPTSYDPNVDDVFDLLVLGARGYLVKPFTAQSVDGAMVQASKGEPLSDTVLNAKDRNEALVALMMGSLDKAATIMRQSYQFETAKKEIPRCKAMFARSADLARTFAKGGDEGLLEAMEKFCIERGQGPATKLGRLRKRLQTGRAVPGAEAEGE